MKTYVYVITIIGMFFYNVCFAGFPYCNEVAQIEKECKSLGKSIEHCLDRIEMNKYKSMKSDCKYYGSTKKLSKKEKNKYKNNYEKMQKQYEEKKKRERDKYEKMKKQPVGIISFTEIDKDIQGYYKVVVRVNHQTNIRCYMFDDQHKLITSKTVKVVPPIDKVTISVLDDKPKASDITCIGLY